MQTKILGKTGINATELSFGVLPLQRTNLGDAVAILQRAYQGGINFFDTARAYSDSEFKLGTALVDVRKNIFIATKTMATTYDGVMKDLQKSLTELKTDYIDIYQLHNPATLSMPDDKTGSYYALLKAKQDGVIRHIGITQHKLALAIDAVESGLYENMQFPISYISSDKELALVKLCKEKNVGFIAMKALCGGLLNNASCAYAFYKQEEMQNVVPIFGMQHMHELEEFLLLASQNISLTDEQKKRIAIDKKELAGSFCRSCYYCTPCPAEIDIGACARMKFLLRRMPYEQFLTDDYRQKMLKIENCIQCGSCASKCPYSLDTPQLLQEMLKDYKEFYDAHAR